jgi:hypothetical protein
MSRMHLSSKIFAGATVGKWPGPIRDLDCFENVHSAHFNSPENADENATDSCSR